MVYPPEGYVKLHIDGAVNPELGLSGKGEVLRDRHEIFVGIRMIAGPHGEDACMVEAAGLRGGLQLFKRCGERKVLVEGDAKVVFEDFERLQNGFIPEDVSEYWNNLLECVDLANTLEDTVIQWIPRRFNTTAHSVAHKAKLSLFSQ